MLVTGIVGIEPPLTNMGDRGLFSEFGGGFTTTGTGKDFKTADDKSPLTVWGIDFGAGAILWALLELIGGCKPFVA